jgi:DNA-binding transcriptional LysR family regulator
MIPPVPGPRVSLDQWRTLQAVLDHGGYAQAAEHLHRSQSSVSYTLAKLQEQLGVPLLEIQGRKAQLTAAGEALLRRSRHLVQEAMELEQYAHSLSQGWEAEVRLVVDAAFPTELLVTALRRFETLGRGTRVQLREVVLSGADEALEQGNADLVIGGRVPPEFLGDLLVEIEFVAVAHPGHPLHRLEREIGVADLERELQVVIRDSGMQRQRDSGWLGAEQRWTVSSMETALAAVRAGLGFAWLPRHKLGSLLEHGQLTPLPLREGSTFQGHMYLIFGDQHQPGPATRQLAELLRSTVAEAGV